MGVKKVMTTLLLVLGMASMVVGLGQINESRNPNTCIVSFAKSLGGKASFELGQSVQKDRLLGIAGLSVGFLFVLVGGALLLKTKE